MEAVVKAYPKRNDEARQDLATTYFINALLDEGQQQYVYTNEVDTMKQTTKLAVAYKNARRTTHKRNVPFCSRVHLIEEENESEPPVRQVSSLCARKKGRTNKEQQVRWNQNLEELTKTVAALAVQVNSNNNQLRSYFQALSQASGIGQGRGGNGSDQCQPQK